MPVTSAEVLHIVCDNAACPGNTLDASDRTGWTFITAEIYGLPTGSYVFCCSACAATISTQLDEARAAAPPALEPQPA